MKRRVIMAFGDALAITNIGDWTAKATLHFVLPKAKVHLCSDEVSAAIVGD